MLTASSAPRWKMILSCQSSKQTILFIISGKCLILWNMFSVSGIASLFIYLSCSCSSYVGHYKNRVNWISLAGGCWSKGIVMHEIAHSLGVFHEQSRPDRDHYVKIHLENIPTSEYQKDFKHYITLFLWTLEEFEEQTSVSTMQSQQETQYHPGIFIEWK